MKFIPLILIACLTCLTGFKHALGPRVVDLGFQKEEDGTDLFILDLTQNARYEVMMLNPKTMVITFQDDVQWMADMRWEAGPQEAGTLLTSYRATPGKRRKNQWKIVVKFRKKIDLMHHSIEKDLDETYQEEGGRISPLFRIRIALQDSQRDEGGTGGRMGGMSKINKGLVVRDIFEKVDDDGARIILTTSVPIDFNTSIDDSGKKIIMEGPSELDWAMSPVPERNYHLLAGYKILENHNEGHDALQLIFRVPVVLESAQVVGTSFVTTVRVPASMGTMLTPEVIREMQYEDMQNDRGGSIKEVRVHELTDVTHVDFHMTDIYEGSATMNHNGEIVVRMPFTDWDRVDVDDFVQKGLFVNYSVINNKQTNASKVLLTLQKGAHLLNVQNIAEGGKYKVRVSIVQDPSYQSPKWLANYGVRELPMENAEKLDLQTQSLVYQGGVSDRVSLGEQLSIGVDVGYSMGEVFYEGAKLPAYLTDEPTIRVRAGIPVYSNEDMKLVFEILGTTTGSGLRDVTGISQGTPFYSERDESVAPGITLAGGIKAMVPVGVAAALYGRAAFGTAWFLHYLAGRDELVKPCDPVRMYMLAVGVESAISDRFSVGVDVGYDWVPEILLPTKKNVRWEGVNASLFMNFMTSPMSGPSAISSQTHVNTGFFLDAGIQTTLIDFKATPDQEDKDLDAPDIYRDRRVMVGWRLGAGYLFVNNPIALSAEVECSMRDTILQKLMAEKNDKSRIDVKIGWDVGMLIKPGLMVNHGVRAFLVLGGLRRWCEQYSGLKSDESEETQRALIKESKREYALNGGVFGAGFDIFATPNVHIGISYAYNVFAEHRWSDKSSGLWRVALSENVLRMQLGYNF